LIDFILGFDPLLKPSWLLIPGSFRPSSIGRRIEHGSPMRPTLAYALTDGRATYSAARVFRPSLYVLRNTIDRQQHCGALNRPGYIAATAKWPQILWIIVRWVFVFMIDVDGLPRERLAAQLARRKRVAMPFIDTVASSREGLAGAFPVSAADPHSSHSS
jgi:hypothetical protein